MYKTTASKIRNFKVVMVGDMAVGKTSLANVFVNDTFKERYSASVGGHFMAKTLENPRVVLQLWDTAGMERFRAMLPHFMKDASCAIIVYDVCDRSTFQSVKDYWISYVEQTATRELIKVLVGNKTDLGVKVVSEADARRVAESHGMFFIETSAKTGRNVNKLFEDAAKNMIEQFPEAPVNNGTLQLETLGYKKSRCCLTPSPS